MTREPLCDLFDMFTFPLYACMMWLNSRRYGVGYTLATSHNGVVSKAAQD